MKGGGFFVTPINMKSGKLESITIVPSKEVKQGINYLTLCL